MTGLARPDRPWLIAGDDGDGELVFWSNDWGWTGADEATFFSDEEKGRTHYLPLGGRWERVVGDLEAPGADGGSAG